MSYSNLEDFQLLQLLQEENGEAFSEIYNRYWKLRNGKGKIVLSSVVDMYCKYPVQTLKFLTPLLPKDTYTFTVSIMGERGNWSDKRKSLYGSTGNFVSLDKISIND